MRCNTLTLWVWMGCMDETPQRLGTAARRRGANIDAEDFAGDSPAHMAATQGHLKVLTALLQVRRGARAGLAALLPSGAIHTVLLLSRPATLFCCAGGPSLAQQAADVLLLFPALYCCFSGSSVSHLASCSLLAGMNLVWRLKLLQAQPAPHIERRNARGVSVRQLAEAAMGRQDLRSW